MMTFSEFTARWQAMPIAPSGFLLVDQSHPIEFNIGYEEIGQKSLIILHTEKISALDSSKSIQATVFDYNEGTPALSFRLIKKDNEDVFLRFCWDLIESSRTVTSDQTGFLINRYLKWLKLMEHQSQDLLSKEEQKGLIGELSFLKFLSQSIGISDAVKSWMGPLDSDQDFQYGDTWAEVKSVSAAATSVSISSIEQLDVLQSGSLIIFRLEETSETNHHGISLGSLATELRAICKPDLNTKGLFENKLFFAGYKDNPAYDERKYLIFPHTEYTVAEGFPRICRTDLADGIEKVKYSISISSIKPFQK